MKLDSHLQWEDTLNIYIYIVDQYTHLRKTILSLELIPRISSLNTFFLASRRIHPFE